MKSEKKKTVLVTGGSGFIASHLVDRLVKTGYFVINLDKIDYCSYDNTKDIPNKYKFIHGNINNKELLMFIFKEYNIEVIFHLAAQTHVDNSFYNSVQFTFDNISGTHTLLEAIRDFNLFVSKRSKCGKEIEEEREKEIEEERGKEMEEGKKESEGGEEKTYSGIKRFIHMSTDEVYGEIKQGENECTESTILKPTNPYSATKAAAELLCSSYYHSFKLPISIVRCNNVFGPRQYPEKVIPAFITNLIHSGNGYKCNIHGKGLTERHFIYVDNVIDAIMCIYEKGEINEIYNISTEECYKIIDLAKLLVKQIKNDEDNLHKYIQFVPDRNFNDYRYLINSEKLEKLGWKPKINFDEGLKRTIQHFMKKNQMSPANPQLK